MKLKSTLMAIAITILFIPSYAGASSIVFETTGWITDNQGFIYEFEASVSPFSYTATLSDLSTDPFFGFDFLFLSITTSTSVIDSIVGPGSFTFPATSGETYFANIFGTGGGTTGTGLFGLEIKAVPIPATLMLLASGLIGLAGLRWRIRKN